MKNERRHFWAADLFYIGIMVIPILAGIVLKILSAPVADGVQIAGAQIYFTIPMPIQNLIITEAQVNSFLVLLSLLGLCLYLTHGLKTRGSEEGNILQNGLLKKQMLSF